MQKIAMLGSGFIGRFYTDSLHGYRNKDRVVSVYSRSEESVKKFAQDYKVPHYTNNMEESVSKAYALLCIDAVKTLNISFDQLFESTNDPFSFSNLGLTLINHYRPTTSQIGTTITVSQTPNHIKRMIAY